MRSRYVVENQGCVPFLHKRCCDFHHISRWRRQRWQAKQEQHCLPQPVDVVRCCDGTGFARSKEHNHVRVVQATLRVTTASLRVRLYPCSGG